MSHVQVSAQFVQKDCLAIIKWWEKKKAAISRRYLKFMVKYAKYADIWLSKMPWYSRIMLVLAYKPIDNISHPKHLKWYFSRPVVAMRLVGENTYVDNAHRLLAAAERVLGENNRLKDPTIMLSSADAEWLKNIMPQTKERL